MDKRQLLKGSGAIIAGTMLSRLSPAENPNPAPAEGPRTNWAGNYTYKAEQLDQPATAQETQELVKTLAHSKALGARHSFNNIADTSGTQISLIKSLDQMTLNKDVRTVTLGAGVTYSELAPWLDSQGFAVRNLASLPHVSVVGACATGTHGSGIHNQNLSTSAAAIKLIDGSGEILTLSRAGDPELFSGAVVGIGALGVITLITIDVVPTFQIAQMVYENLSFDQLEHNLDAIFSSGYSVSLFTDWQNHRATQVWIKQTVPGKVAPHLPPLFYGATLQKTKLHPIAGHSAESCTEQLGIPGPWYDRLPHFRINFTPSSGAELQSEYFVPRARAYEAILAVEQLRQHITPHLFITELRTIAADNLWMSMAYQRDSLSIHFTWKPEWSAVKQVLPLIEEKLAPFGARPHWAKLFTTPPARLRQLYPKFADFEALAKRYDPNGKFRNEFLNRNLYGA